MELLINPWKFSALVGPLVVTLLFASCLSAQSVTRTFDESFANPGDVSVVQSRGPLTILPAKDDKVRVVTEMTVEGKTEADAEAFLTKLEAEAKELGGRLFVKIGLANVRNWNQNNSSIKVVFQDGSKFTGIRNFELSTTIYLPKTQRLTLETRFERVDVDPEVKIGDLKLKLKNAKFRGGGISGDLELDVRFGEVEVGNVGGALTGTMHNVKSEFGNIGDVRLESRFSRLRMGTVKSLDMKSSNDHLEAKSVTGEVDIEDRFGNYILGGTSNGRINSHNGTFEIESAGAYKIEATFGNFDFDRIDVLSIRDNRNTDYDIKELGSIDGNGSFTTIGADQLSQGAELSLNNGKLRVDEVGPKFRGVEVEGQFFEVDLNFRESTNYHVYADLTFGDVRLPKELVTVKEIKEHSKLQMELKTPNAGKDSPIISVKGRNGKLVID